MSRGSSNFLINNLIVSIFFKHASYLFSLQCNHSSENKEIVIVNEYIAPFKRKRTNAMKTENGFKYSDVTYHISSSKIRVLLYVMHS